ncbi:hypothetical protein BC938DRAFT_474103 [Jimgerdemannia flammicorona]|uniref:Uncharacterized protein n=1 Tax=Jimgerdemannia flammicorona TaxID=994334 RepID=A0A433QZJ1_9FUNG|nr:hypothetical protein BC938DRAFT_474103 [Jimgerdemannia flammicorona]
MTKKALYDLLGTQQPGKKTQLCLLHSCTSLPCNPRRSTATIVLEVAIRYLNLERVHHNRAQIDEVLLFP